MARRGGTITAVGGGVGEAEVDFDDCANARNGHEKPMATLKTASTNRLRRSHDILGGDFDFD